jgi:hypothetical protein
MRGRDGVFTEAAGNSHGAIDAAYHAKYDRYGPKIVGSVVGPQAERLTIRLVPVREEPAHGESS